MAYGFCGDAVFGRVDSRPTARRSLWNRQWVDGTDRVSGTQVANIHYEGRWNHVAFAWCDDATVMERCDWLYSTYFVWCESVWIGLQMDYFLMNSVDRKIRLPHLNEYSIPTFCLRNSIEISFDFFRAEKLQANVRFVSIDGTFAYIFVCAVMRGKCVRSIGW